MKTRANAQYNILAFFQVFWQVILWLIIFHPVLVIGWYFLTSIGTPEPAWWNELEMALGIWW